MQSLSSHSSYHQRVGDITWAAKEHLNLNVKTPKNIKKVLFTDLFIECVWGWTIKTGLTSLNSFSWSHYSWLLGRTFCSKLHSTQKHSNNQQRLLLLNFTLDKRTSTGNTFYIYVDSPGPANHCYLHVGCRCFNRWTKQRETEH